MEKQTNSRPFANKKTFRTGKLGISPILFEDYINQLGTDKIETTLNKGVDIIIMGAEPSPVAIERYERMVREQGYSAQVYSESEFYELIKNTLGIVPEIEDYSNNPFWYRRIILSGQFSHHSIKFYRETLQKRGALLNPDQVSKNTNFVILGTNPDKKVIDGIEKQEFNGFHLKQLNEDDLLKFLNGEKCDFFVTEENKKSLSLSIKHITQKAFTFDKYNPFSTKELFLGKQIKGDRQCFRQAMGNLGAFTNDTMESDTDVCILSDETYNSLMKGEKDETIQYIENYYNVEAGDVFTYEFVTEGALMKWAKQHCKAISDNCTLEYINKYLGVQNSPLQDEIEEAFEDTNDNYVVVDDYFYFRLSDGRIWCPSAQHRGVKYKYVEPTWADEKHESKEEGMQDFTVIEVETTEIKKKTYPCQIGLVVVHNGIIEENICELIKTPGNKYDQSKTKRFGITPDDTATARSFRQVWDDIKVHFDGQFIVAFDGKESLTALHNSFKKYDIEEPEIIGYYSICNNVDKNINKAGAKYGIDTSTISDCSDMAKVCTDIYMLLGKHAEISECTNNSKSTQEKFLKSFVAIDFEHLCQNGDKYKSACEIGMVKFVDGIEVDTFHSYIKPITGLYRSEWAKENLSHITDEMLSNAPTFTELHPKIKEFIGDNMLVCHNRGTDLNIIYGFENNPDCRLSETYHNGWADTMDICNFLSDNKKLDENYTKLFGKPMDNHHQALDDARACAKIFAELNKRTNLNGFIHYEEYIPSISESEVQNIPSSSSTRTVPSDPLLKYLEDESIPTIDFSAKRFVISGASSYRDLIVDRLKELGAKKVADFKQKQTPDFFIIGKEVGSSKIKDAEIIKQETPDSFHIISQEAVARFLGLC